MLLQEALVFSRLLQRINSPKNAKRLFDFCQINAKGRGERKSGPVAVGAEDRWCGILSAS